MKSVQNTIQELLKNRSQGPIIQLATSFAPVNIALIKYWGKRDASLNLPITNSLSIALPSKGTTTTIHLNNEGKDNYYLNDNYIEHDSEFGKRLKNFCDFFRFDQKLSFTINTYNNIPTAAGLASSASGYAALVLAFNQLFGWQLDKTSLSILARIGSGSACRSLWDGFVEWQKGDRQDGLDSYGYPLEEKCFHDFASTLKIGLLIFEKNKKIISSRDAMRITVNTSPSYRHWPTQVENDLREIKAGILAKNFEKVGEIAERNALAMHATLLDSQPSMNYCTEQTYYYREKIWELRRKNIPIYFTQDAGPNLKLLFQKEASGIIEEVFPECERLG